MTIKLGILASILVSLSCSSTPVEEQFLFSVKNKFTNQKVIDFDRTQPLIRLKNKLAKKEPLVVHVFVPLCDNKNQGIVQVSKSLGDGFNLKTNLYWGALYGVKTHFKKLKDWSLIKSFKIVSDDVLERVIFEKTTANNQKVYLIADAYKGDQMETCLNDFFKAIAGKNKSKVAVNESLKLNLASKADFILFNGHNGLMDVAVAKPINTDGVIRDAGVVGCVSHSYFKEHFKSAKAYPLLMTTNFMAPEAYVLEGAINSWLKASSGETIRKQAGVYYNKYQKYGIKGSTRLFKTGW